MFLTYYYRALDRVVGTSQKSVSTIATKIVVDQVFNAPVCNILFFGFTSFYSGGHIGDRIDRFKRTMSTKFWSTMIADCSVWPAANAINFKYVPVNYRPSFVGFCQIFWNAYLCGQSFSDGPTCTGKGKESSLETPKSMQKVEFTSRLPPEMACCQSCQFQVCSCEL